MTERCQGFVFDQMEGNPVCGRPLPCKTHPVTDPKPAARPEGEPYCGHPVGEGMKCVRDLPCPFHQPTAEPTPEPPTPEPPRRRTMRCPTCGFGLRCPGCGFGAKEPGGTPEQGSLEAARIVSLWERIEGESMREGHRRTLELLIASALRAHAAEKDRSLSECSQEVAKQHIRADAAEKQLNTITQAMQDDIGALLRVLGMFDGARPQSPQEVMREAIREVQRLKRAAESLADAAEASLPALSPHAQYVEREQRLWDALVALKARATPDPPSGQAQPEEWKVTGMGDRTPDCGEDCWKPVECSTCHRTKAPRGRSVALAMAGGLCDPDCIGYHASPRPGHLWPNEGRGQSGRTGE